MKIISYDALRQKFLEVLRSLNFPEEKAMLCAKIFADNTLDGVNSHGINRFRPFVNSVKRGDVNPLSEPEVVQQNGVLETWDGHFGIGIYNASRSMARACELAKQHGVGVVALRHNNHWMRGGTYGWQAVAEGCIGICFTNAVANMPPYGGKEPRLGNNPIVMAVPRKDGPVVLDTALSQFSYGKMYSYELEGEKLPFPGGYDAEGNLTDDPHAIRKSMRALPIGFWKGSGLALLFDVVLTALSGGRSTAKITEDYNGQEKNGTETGVSQCFIALHQEDFHPQLIDEILAYTRSATPVQEGRAVRYPGEGTLRTREKNLKEGIPVNEKIWEALLNL